MISLSKVLETDVYLNLLNSVKVLETSSKFYYVWPTSHYKKLPAILSAAVLVIITITTILTLTITVIIRIVIMGTIRVIIVLIMIITYSRETEMKLHELVINC